MYEHSSTYLCVHGLVFRALKWIAIWCCISSCQRGWLHCISINNGTRQLDAWITTWVCLGIQFLHVHRRLFGSNSWQMVRDVNLGAFSIFVRLLTWANRNRNRFIKFFILIQIILEQLSGYLLWLILHLVKDEFRLSPEVWRLSCVMLSFMHVPLLIRRLMKRPYCRKFFKRLTALWNNVFLFLMRLTIFCLTLSVLSWLVLGLDEATGCFTNLVLHHFSISISITVNFFNIGLCLLMLLLCRLRLWGVTTLDFIYLLQPA